MSVSSQTVLRQIEGKLASALSPELLRVENESHMHSVPADAETHFKVTIVSDAFAGQRLVSRHRRTYQILAGELNSGVHALAIHAYTSGEWSTKEQAPDSPPCHGNS